MDQTRGLQGLNARLELINKHPFYNQQAFDQSKGSDFEAWKLSELEVLPRQIACLYGDYSITQCACFFRGVPPCLCPCPDARECRR